MSRWPKIRKSWIFATLSLLTVAYLMVMWSVASARSEARLCEGIIITVHDTAQYRFVTPEELGHELGDLTVNATRTPLSKINIDSIEKMLAAFDKIEKVSVNILTNGYVSIDVDPMHPVARIFPMAGGDSYYINSGGKRIKADARYHLDVPVVVGNFDDMQFPATSILPLVDYVSRDSMFNNLVSMIKVDSPTDIILVPSIRGHVINVGDTLDYPDKFSRLKRIYSQVMNVRGWEFYDTISVKWHGQIVASRRDKSLPEVEMIIETSNSEEVDIETMLTAPNIAPGQAHPNDPANNEKPIPGHTVPPSTPPTMGSDQPADTVH